MPKTSKTKDFKTILKDAIIGIEDRIPGTMKEYYDKLLPFVPSKWKAELSKISPTSLPVHTPVNLTMVRAKLLYIWERCEEGPDPTLDFDLANALDILQSIPTGDCPKCGKKL
jgi:hypothetical protein